MSRARRSGTGGKVSLADVAACANVSLATASRVMSGATYPVAAATRERVLQAATDLSYAPNLIARALVRRMTNTIGVVIGDITDSYFAEIARGVEDQAYRRDFLTIICNTDRSPAVENAYFRLLLDHHAAGIIIAGGAFPQAPENEAFRELAKEASRSATRLVMLTDRDVEAPVISVDDRMVTMDLTRYLIGLGHRRIAYVEGLTGLSTSLRRGEGFARAMTEAGLDASLRYPGGFGIEPGRAAAALMLRNELPDAVIAASDEAAFGVLTTLQQGGVEIPRQVSVAGIDDNRHAQLFNLTTMRLPTYDLGAMAAKWVIGDEPCAPDSRVTLPCRVIPRGTTSWISTADRKGALRAG
jgi:LacI family transcriptional regulator